MDVSHTIVPRSDQLNADDLLVAPETVTIAMVKEGSEKQELLIFLHGYEKRPYKPCKSMRRVLIAAWGADAREWIGRTMTLYNDPNVIYGGVKVGGIRISHLSHIEGDLDVMLTVSKGKRAAYRVRPMQSENEGRARGGPLRADRTQPTAEQPQPAGGVGDQGTVEPTPPAFLTLPENARETCERWWHRIAAATRSEAVKITDEPAWQKLLARLEEIGATEAKEALVDRMKEAMGL